VQIELVDVTTINPAPYNPRVDLKPGDPEYDALVKSLERWDTVQPLVWNKRTGNLVAGHQRLKVLKARGDHQVHVSVVDLNDKDERALNLALNKISGNWDREKLHDVLQDLVTDTDWLMELQTTGFDFGEVSQLTSEFMNQPVEPLYQPVTTPTIERQMVTDGSFQAAASAEGRRFAKPQHESLDITCPHCGKEFAVAGTMAEKLRK
jgi:hypothetical protein